MYATVPTVVPAVVSSGVVTARDTPSGAAVVRATPKSRILALPRFVTKMFAGLMSRCTMPAAWAASSASATSPAIATIDEIAIGPAAVSRSSGVPSRYSIAMYAVPSLSPTS